MQSHWIHVQRLAEALLFILRTKTDDGIDCYFATSGRFSSIRHAKDLRASLHNHRQLLPPKPSKVVSLQDTLETIIGVEGAYGRQFTHPTRRGFFRPTPKEAIIFVFTDGIWHPETTTGIHDQIKNMVHILEERHQRANHFGIQFVRFGDDPGGAKVLEELDNMELKSGLSDIVDVEPYENGNVLKMLLGSVNKWFDYADREDEDTSSLKDDLEDNSEVQRHVSRNLLPTRKSRVQELDDQP